MRAAKKTSWGVFYKVKSLDEVNSDLISTLNWPKGLCLGILFPKCSLTKFPAKNIFLKTKFKVLLCCQSKGKCFNTLYPAADKCGIEIRPPKNIKELKQVQAEMLKELLRRVEYKRTREYKKTTAAYIKNYLTDTKSVFVLRRGRIEGLFSLLSAIGGNLDSVVYDGITWHQFPEALSVKERKSLYFQISVWLSKIVKRKVAVKIDLRDKEIFRFLSGLGFAASNLQVFRK